MKALAFFMGKGGVGKTTCSAAYAVACAERGLKVLVVSLDPAHNLGDVLGAELGDEPRAVAGNLYACEVDFDAMVKRHLENLARKLKEHYRYLKALNLDKYLDVLRLAPGVEEQAALDKIVEIMKRCEEEWKFDVLVFDTPPTGLMLRIIALPQVTVLWTRKLMELREAILARRKALERALGSKPRAVVAGEEVELPTSREEDPVYRELEAALGDALYAEKAFREAKLFMVVNPESLPIIEARRAARFLAKLGLRVEAIIVNKASEDLARLRGMLSDLVKEAGTERVITIPRLSYEPRGAEGLREVALALEGLVP